MSGKVLINLAIVVSILVPSWQQNLQGCLSKDFGYGSFVCVCNVSYCDSLQPIEVQKSGRAVVVMSNKASKRWQMSEGQFSDSTLEDEGEADIILKFNKSIQFQTILGFGGAFTDASGINIKSLSTPVQEHLIRSYYDLSGLEYNLGRVPIAGTDFSTHPYSYDDLSPGQVDPMLKRFALANEDLQYKIPLIQQAMKLSLKRGVSMKFYGSPWSGPGWMKDNGKINGKGKLLKKYYPTWASYIVKFLQAYKAHGISFYGLTTQNEPTTGFIKNYPFNTMGWLPEEQAEWIAEHLGPQLYKSGYGNVTVFMLDDSRPLLPAWIVKIMLNKEAVKYVGGIAVHWYYDWLFPPRLLDITHNYYPDLLILYTEACLGSKPWDLLKVLPGSWARAEDYAADIIENLQHWVAGWTDWNIALDLEGGPNWVKNFVDSPVIVNQATEEFYKQPMYYALAHFSKVLPEGSVRIETDLEGKKKDAANVVSFRKPDGSFASVILNRNSFPLRTAIIDNGKQFQLTLDPRSITSVIWKN